MDSWTNEQMKQLIPMVNEIQDAFVQAGRPLTMDLPQIVVVGEQSAGKSSVLENFVGKDFLPRGSGIVTRRPLVLHLLSDKENEYGEFLHKKGQKFHDFHQIRTEIEKETERVASSTISPIPITLDVHSPNVLNLTLIDLPGLVKVPRKDIDPPDIERIVTDMVLEYITPKSSLILAVIPANIDLATSDALKLARQVDTDDSRTIGVLTKLDIIGQGQNARKTLNNQVIPLKRGYIGVINRSQEDIKNEINVQDALKNEHDYFLSDDAYKDMADKMGTKYLQKVLNQQLTEHIWYRLPQQRKLIQQHLANVKNDVEKYKEFDSHHVPSNNDNKQQEELGRMIMKYREEVQRSIECLSSKFVPTDEPTGGAKIKQIFHTKLPNEITKLDRTMDDREMRLKISKTIVNIEGIQGGPFIPIQAFEATVKQQILRLEEPSLHCLAMVIDELIDVIAKASEPIARYPNLQEKLVELTQEALEIQQRKAREQVTYLIKHELSYINTNHEDFRNSVAEIPGSTIQIKNPLNLIKKGTLNIHVAKWKGGSKSYWFVLTANSISWYKDHEEKEKEQNVELEGLVLKAGVEPKKIILIYPDEKKNVYKHHKRLELSAQTEEESKSWIEKFADAGVYSENRHKPSDIVKPSLTMTLNSVAVPDDDEQLDPALQKKAQIVLNMIKTYMDITKKTIKDMVPKVIMCWVVTSISDFVCNRLVQLYQTPDMESLMEESEEEVRRRDETFRLYEACTKALEIVDEAMKKMKLVVIRKDPALDKDRLEVASTATSTCSGSLDY